MGGTHLAETPFVKPGDTATLEIDLKPGRYVLTCPATGHTEHGMNSRFEVEA